MTPAKNEPMSPEKGPFQRETIVFQAKNAVFDVIGTDGIDVNGRLTYTFTIQINHSCRIM